ncbi:MAG: hypothetical protein LBU32_11215 [Clostridiales bacterium]|jgi:hypothetical protein|nr:hypothetical protein [Clostridiales bacterium]
MRKSIENIWNALFPPKKEPAQQAYAHNSIFRRFIDAANTNDPGYETLKQAVSYCDEALKIARQRISLASEIVNFEEKMESYSSVKNMSEMEIRRINNALDRYVNAARERANLLEQLTTFDKTLYDMIELEGEAQAAVAQIQDAERNQRILRRDIGQLQGEKDALEHEEGILVQGVNNIIKTAFVLAGVFVVASVLLAYFALARGSDIFWTSSAMAVMAASLGFTIYAFRRRALYELEINLRKRRRAARLISTKNVMYAYYTNYLSFCYEKYNVKSSAMLSGHLSDMENYKQVLSRIEAIRQVMHEAQEEAEDLLQEFGIKNDAASLESFAKNNSIASQKAAYEILESKKLSAERALTSLDKRHEEIWDMLSTLSKRNPMSEKLIDAVIQAYMDELRKFMDDKRNPGSILEAEKNAG